MSKKNKQTRKARRRERRWLKKVEERSDRRTADFVVRRLDGIETDLGDLIPDLQTFNDFVEISQMTWCIRFLRDIRKKYQKRADGSMWEDE